MQGKTYHFPLTYSYFFFWNSEYWPASYFLSEAHIRVKLKQSWEEVMSVTQVMIQQ